MSGTGAPIDWAGVEPALSRTTMVPTHLSSVDSSYLFSLFGKPDDTYQSSPKYIQNVTMETIYQLYANREVKFLSMKMSEMLILRNGSWILALLAPIQVSTEQNFRMFRNMVNIVPHQPVPPGGIPRMFTTSRYTWMASKQSSALMGGIDVRVLLDRENGPPALADIMYGLSVSVLFTLQQQTIIEAVRKAHDRNTKNTRGNVNAYLDPQRQLTWEAHYFGCAARDPTNLLYNIQQFAKTVSPTLGANLIILWQGGRTRIQTNSLTTAVKLNAWVESQDPITKQIYRQQLPIDGGEQQIVQGPDGIAYVEIPNLRLKDSDPEFNALQTNCTIAQYYVEQAANHVNDKATIGRADVEIYDLPVDNMKALRVGSALAHAGVYADVGENMAFGGKGDDVKSRYSRELHAYVQDKNAGGHVQPRGQDAPDRKQLEYIASREDPSFFDFENPLRKNQPDRDQFLFTSWDPMEKEFFIPEYIGSFERRHLTPAWVDIMARDASNVLSQKGGIAVAHILNDLKELVIELDSREGNYEWFIAVLSKNYERIYRSIGNQGVVKVGENTPEERTAVHGAPPLVEFIPNVYGSLDLPDDVAGIPSGAILAGYANGPGLRTIAAEATKADTRYRFVAEKAAMILRAFDQFIDIISTMFRGSDMINPKLASPWFHRDDILTVVIENLFASRPPLFFHVPPATRQPATEPVADVFAENQKPQQLNYPGISFALDDVERFYAGNSPESGDASGVRIDALGLSPSLAATSTISNLHRIVAKLGPAGASLYKSLVIQTQSREIIKAVLKTVLLAERFDFTKLEVSGKGSQEVNTAKEILIAKGDLRFPLTEYAVFQYLVSLTAGSKDEAKVLEYINIVNNILGSGPKPTAGAVTSLAKSLANNININSKDTKTTYQFFGSEPKTLEESIRDAPLATQTAQRLVVLRSFHGDKTAADLSNEVDVKSADDVQTAYSDAYGKLLEYLGEQKFQGFLPLDEDDIGVAATAILHNQLDTAITKPNGDGDFKTAADSDVIDTIVKNYKKVLDTQQYGFEDVDNSGTAIGIIRARTVEESTVSPDLTGRGFAAAEYVRSPLTASGRLTTNIFSKVKRPGDRPIVIPGDKETLYTKPLEVLPTNIELAPEFAPIKSTNKYSDLQNLPIARGIAGINNKFESVQIKGGLSSFAQKQQQTQPTTKQTKSRGFGSFDFDVEGSSGINNGFKSASAAGPNGGYGNWNLPPQRRGDAMNVNTGSSNVFQRPVAARALRGPWRDRLNDFNMVPAKNALHEFLRFTILFTPNRLDSMQQLANQGINLPFDVVFWRLGMSYRMNNILIARAGSMTLQLSPAHVRTVTDNMRGEVYFQNWIEYLPLIMDEMGMVFLPNVCPAGWNGGVNTEYVKSPASDLLKDHSAQPSVIVTVQPLTEALTGVVHFTNSSVFEGNGITTNYSGPQTQSFWSGAEYYATRYYSEYVRWAKVDDNLRAGLSKYDIDRKAQIDAIYLQSMISLLVFPGPHIAMSSTGEFNKLVNGLGPAGELAANWPGAKQIWGGTPGQWPQPNILTLINRT